MLKRIYSLFVVVSLSFAAALPTGVPEQSGMSTERLKRIDGVMKKHIADGDLNGASGLIVRNGKVVFRGAWGEVSGVNYISHLTTTIFPGQRQLDSMEARGPQGPMRFR